MKYQEWNTTERICRNWRNDCTVRSLSIVLNKPYKKVFSELMHIGLEMGAYPDHDKVWITYAEDQGLVKRKCPRKDDNRLVKLREWDFKGAAVVRNSGHLTAVMDGYVIDIWDCTYRPVNTYWEKIN